MKIPFDIDPELVARAERVATERGTTIQEVVTTAMVRIVREQAERDAEQSTAPSGQGACPDPE